MKCSIIPGKNSCETVFLRTPAAAFVPDAGLVPADVFAAVPVPTTVLVLCAVPFPAEVLGSC